MHKSYPSISKTNKELESIKEKIEELIEKMDRSKIERLEKALNSYRNRRTQPDL